MEKRRIKFSLLLKASFFILLLPAGKPGQAQQLQTVKGYCGIYYRTMADLYRQKQAELDFYQFRPGQAVASIGAQCCHWEAVYAAVSDSVHFYLQDIDTTYFNPRQAGFAWHYYDSIRGKPMTSRFTMVTGNEKATGLPEGIFDKILIINSFHEFSDKAAMLADIGTKLKPGGLLYIDESVPKRSGQLHGICKLPMLLPEEMLAILTKNGYEFVSSRDINFRKGRPYRKIYAFKTKT